MDIEGGQWSNVTECQDEAYCVVPNVLGLPGFLVGKGSVLQPLRKPAQNS